MKIADFIDTFKNTEYKDKLVQKHITKPYMHWLMKVAEAENIIQKSCYDEDGKFRLNSPLRYYLFIVSTIKNYTDLEFEKDEIIHDFNILEENGVNDMIVGMVEDVGRFAKVIQMTIDDHMENHRSLVGYVDGKSEAFSTVLNVILDGIEEASKNAEVENN